MFEPIYLVTVDESNMMSCKKKIRKFSGTLIGAPVGIALIAGLSIPGIVFGVPVFVGRKVHQRFKYKSKIKRRLLTATCVVGSLVVSPVMAVMAVGMAQKSNPCNRLHLPGVGVPIMLAYVYGVVPLSLCRNGGCGLSSSDSSLALATIDEEQLYGTPGGMWFMRRGPGSDTRRFRQIEPAK